jgi:Rho-binding antiterminator
MPTENRSDQEQSKTKAPGAYAPIDCDFHDYLEELSTLDSRCEILFTDINGSKQNRIGHIDDIFTHNHEEFLRLRDGFVLRLDRIESVNGRHPRGRQGS